jgi:hypothetical protein
MSTEGDLSTEDLARSGDAGQEDLHGSDARREQTPAASEMAADRPQGDVSGASVQGDPRKGMPQGVDPGYGQEAEAGGPRDGAGAAAARAPDAPGPVPDSLGGGAGDQGARTQPGGPEGGTSPAGSGEPGAAPRSASSPATDGGERPPGDGRIDGPGGGGETALLGSADEDRFRERWGDAQARFVDDPQEAVRSADRLVAELMQSLAKGFSEHKARLEAQWQRGGDPETEELRQALQHYRSFFDRLLST